LPTGDPAYQVDCKTEMQISKFLVHIEHGI